MKIFGIGLARTGTLSLCSALRILGYSCVHFPRSIQEIESNDASVDTSVTLGWKFLDLMYPESKFIITTRPIDDWLGSCKRYWERYHKVQHPFVSKLHKHLYGTEDFDKDFFEIAREEHVNSLVDQVVSRPNDFLILNLAWDDAQKWRSLCDFLGKEIPNEPYPHDHSWEEIIKSEQAING